MPDSSGKPLPPLPKEALDGERYEASIPAYGSLGTCTHKNKITYENGPQGNCLRCSCGAIFVGPNLAELYTLLTS